MHLVKGDLYYHQNSRMHFLKENKRIGEIPLSISLSLFSSDPKTFQNRSIFMEREALAAFRSFFRSMFMEREALAAFRSFFSINVHGT